MTCSYSKEFSMVAFTDIENIFITEYMPDSPGDAVKVYLYGLFLCQNNGLDLSLSDIAKALKMSEDLVKENFAYWEEFGLISIVSPDPFTVQYLPIRIGFNAKPRKIKAEKYADFTKGVQALFPNRMISTGEYTEYFTIMETYSIKPDAFLMIVKYCIDLKGSSITYRYISKVAKDFGNRGITTLDKVEIELSSYMAKNAMVVEIFKAMNVKRQPEIEDADLFKKWTKELLFDPENILFAAKNLKKGSMKKLDEFLTELYSMKCFSKEEMGEFLQKKQYVYELAVKINRALSVYEPVLDTVIDTYTNKWDSYGFSEDALLFIANECFKSNKKTLRDMDEQVEYFRERGFITLSSLGDYFNQIKEIDIFLSKMLATCGINRRPNSWDRENYSTWKNWNFSPDMILEAAKLASGKSSPISYMNGILSNWKASGVYTQKELSSTDPGSQENYNLEYERRRSLALSRAQKNLDKAKGLDGFSDIYSRLNAIEKDLAFAEIANDTTTLSALENEKEQLFIKAENLLSTLNLTLRELSPVYACEKCNDTGYVGTKRCDCYDKKVN